MSLCSRGSGFIFIKAEETVYTAAIVHLSVLENIDNENLQTVMHYPDQN